MRPAAPTAQTLLICSITAIPAVVGIATGKTWVLDQHGATRNGDSDDLLYLTVGLGGLGYQH